MLEGEVRGGASQFQEMKKEVYSVLVVNWVGKRRTGYVEEIGQCAWLRIFGDSKRETASQNKMYISDLVTRKGQQ